MTKPHSTETIGRSGDMPFDSSLPTDGEEAMTETPTGAAATKQAIISSALLLFGEYGYNAVSTRKIAEHSDANIGSIAYHFGGKPGLMRACALYVIEAAEESFGKALLQPVPEDMSPEQAREEIVMSIARLMTPIEHRNDAEQISVFIMRYLVQSSDAFDLLYEQFVSPVHQRLRQLLAKATGLDVESEETRVLTFMLMGQSMYFRICGNIVKRSMEWESYGPAECRAIRQSLVISTNAILDAYSAGKAA